MCAMRERMSHLILIVAAMFLPLPYLGGYAALVTLLAVRRSS
jgi:hypothetical protein